MHHYFEAITNTSGDSLVGYFARVIDPASQNTIVLSSDNNGTPIEVISGVDNMAKTDAFGNLDFYVVPGTYHLDIYAPNSTSFIMRVANVAMNSGVGPQGDPGPEGPPGEGLETVMAPTGAGVVGYQRPVSGSVAQKADAAIAALGVTAGNKGVVSDGSANDATAIQSMVTDANASAVPVLLTKGSSAIGAPINLRDAFVRVRGNPYNGNVIARAGSSPSFIFDVERTSEISYSPFAIDGVDCNGQGLVTTAAIGVRYRRNYVIENSILGGAPIGIRIKDGNSGIMRNIRTSGVAIGLHSIGSNHQTTHDTCSFNGASDVGIKIESLGTENDGNHALTFLGCLSQDNARCVEVNFNTSADWFGGYIGESTTGYAVDNKGGIFTMHGGIAFFDLASAPGNSLVHPIGSGVNGRGGLTHFIGTRLAASSSNGIGKLVHLEPGEVDLAKNGKVIFENVDLYALAAGGGVFNGDPFGVLKSGRNLIRRNGSGWSAATAGGSTFTDTVSGNARTVTATAGTPPSIIGFSTPLLNTDYRTDGPMFLIMCYQSTKPLVIRTGTAPLTGGGTDLGTAPATGPISANGWKTYIVFEAMPNALASGVLEMFVNGTAVEGDACSVLRVGLADADFVKSNGKAGVCSNLYYP